MDLWRKWVLCALGLEAELNDEFLVLKYFILVDENLILNLVLAVYWERNLVNIWAVDVINFKLTVPSCSLFYIGDFFGQMTLFSNDFKQKTAIQHIVDPLYSNLYSYTTQASLLQTLM